ncbi:MAG: 3-oxoacyl-[acyl-carrier protein] reductase [Chloroflexota bacterium]|jgi:3-oxoacyl-[acyl-carrier protein] reductase|nr:3-oxoacyl-[acyl-carrier protein] reductase [Chloroflexota bacterium]
MLLEGKVAIVTGAGHGIGRAYSLGIAREGGRVVVADIDGKAADQVAEEIGAQALAVRADVADLESCKAMAQRALEAFGQIDGLVNNAAIFATIPISRVGFQQIDEAEWDKVMEVNVKGVWNCCRAVVPAMQARKQGSIVNISSGTVINGSAGRVHYVASKAAVMGMSRVLARELGEDNIRVNTIAPGSTLSEAEPDERILNLRQANVSTRALKRVERPDDLVGTVLYLLSDLSSFVTGSMIAVNGGDVMY